MKILKEINQGRLGWIDILMLIILAAAITWFNFAYYPQWRAEARRWDVNHGPFDSTPYTIEDFEREGG